METRGSLAKMVALLPFMFRNTGANRLGIINKPSSHYYSIVDEDVFLNKVRYDIVDETVPVLLCTKKEFQSMFKSAQLSLSKELDDATQ